MYVYVCMLMCRGVRAPQHFATLERLLAWVHTCAAALWSTHAYLCTNVSMDMCMHVLKVCLPSAACIHYVRFHKPWQIILHGSTSSLAMASIQHVVNARTHTHTHILKELIHTFISIRFTTICAHLKQMLICV